MFDNTASSDSNDNTFRTFSESACALQGLKQSILDSCVAYMLFVVLDSWRTIVFKNLLIVVCSEHSATWCKIGPFTARPLKKFEFYKSKMADICHSENRKIAISLQPYDRFWWNLAQWHILAPYRGSFVKLRFFWKSNMAAAPCWKSQKSRYLYEIWYAGAKWVS